MIRLSEAHIGYSQVLLKATNLDLQEGVVYVLVGKNGVGKSTFLQSLTGQIPLLSGYIEINGRLLNDIPKREIPTILSFVPVQFPQMDYVQGQEYIAAGRSPYTNVFGKLTENDKTLVDDALQILNIEHLKDRFTSELSDGEKQLVAIAKVIAQEAPHILLDEPTAFLDYPNKNVVLALLKKIAKEMNKCVIISAHDLDLCLVHCSHFIVANKSTQALSLLEAPTKEELLDAAFGE
ncbi:MAG: iron complex transport system ATP-binding protein [Crocinitomicaceae bacterium]|jgi:iron complex transport system ATP-binding protein